MRKLKSKMMVIVHDTEHGKSPDIVKGFRELAPGISSVWSYTDLGDRENPYNWSLQTASSFAGLIVVQDVLLVTGSRDGIEAVSAASMLVGPEAMFGTFDHDYNCSLLTIDALFSMIPTEAIKL